MVPKSLLFNWHSECTRFAPSLKTIEYSGIGRAAQRADLAKHDIVLTTYGTLRRDISILKDIAFDYVVLDEAQTIKNAGSQIAKASRLLSARHRLALSGTPIENNLGRPVVDLRVPESRACWGAARSSSNSPPEPRTTRLANLLSQGLRPFILRRTKKEVASELPEKLEQTIHCDMRKEQRRVYHELRDSYRAALARRNRPAGAGQDENARAGSPAATAAGRLPSAPREPGERRGIVRQARRAAARSRRADLRGAQGRWSSRSSRACWRSSASTSTAGASFTNISTARLATGKERVNRFQTDPACCVFLISLKAGGLGLNLTAADYVFLLDPWWNPAVEAQAIDRAHRVGQTRKVFAYRLICRGTVEEKIAELQDQKRSLADAILQADASLLKDLTVEDLEKLLS